jgi:hypothetical protein
MELTVAIRGTADADGWTAWAERDAYDPEPTLPHRSNCSAPASFTAQWERHFRIANDHALGRDTSTDLKHAAVNIRILVPTGVRARSVKPRRLLAELFTRDKFRLQSHLGGLYHRYRATSVL